MSDKENSPVKGKFAERLKKIAEAVKNLPRKTKATPSFVRKDTYTLEQLIAVGRKRKTKGDTERLAKEQKIQKRAEILYRLDPLVFAGVNRLKRLIATPRIYWTGGSEEDRKKMEDWSKQVRLKKTIQEGTQDVIIYGYSIIEKIKDKNGLPVKLITVDPKTMDWEKDGEKLKVDAYGDPVGFVQVQEGGADINLKREEVVLLRLFTLGRECLGITPLEPAFKAAWIRLNLEEAYGEAIFRHGYPLYYFKVGDKDHPITVELIRDAKKILKNFDTADELILPDWIEPGRLDPKTEIRAVIELWTFLAGEVARALDSPISFILPMGARGESKGGVEFASIDLEKAVKDYQEILKDELDEQLFQEVREKLNIKTIPELKFAESSPQTQLLRMRMIAMLSARGALHVDPTTENALRQELGLPLLPTETGVKDETGIEINEEVSLECLEKVTSKTSLVKKNQKRKKK